MDLKIGDRIKLWHKVIKIKDGIKVDEAIFVNRGVFLSQDDKFIKVDEVKRGIVFFNKNSITDLEVLDE